MCAVNCKKDCKVSKLRHNLTTKAYLLTYILTLPYAHKLASNKA